MDEHLPRKLTAILYADVAGYSRLTGLDEVGTHEQLSFSLDLIADRIATAGGRVVHYAGDAVLADFDSVMAATRCAIGIQEAIAANSVPFAEDRRLLFRIGVNMGDVIVDRDDIYGDGVNIAARLESLAPPGGICVSEAVRNEIYGKIGVDLQDLGDQKLRTSSIPLGRTNSLSVPRK
jgi:adenylate cyclase